MGWCGESGAALVTLLSCLVRWEEKGTNGVKWRQLEHKGPYFTPAYEPLPDSVRFLYDGKGEGPCTRGFGLSECFGLSLYTVTMLRRYADLPSRGCRVLFPAS